MSVETITSVAICLIMDFPFIHLPDVRWCIRKNSLRVLRNPPMLRAPRPHKNLLRGRRSIHISLLLETHLCRCSTAERAE
jgi:hypothetical protein